jgi:hypothetical protein
MKLTDWEAPNGDVFVRDDAIISITPIYGPINPRTNEAEIKGSTLVVGGVAHKVRETPDEINKAGAGLDDTKKKTPKAA